ncbi:acyl carrier protein [Streptomyces roseus]|uniref:acyl carrier protein n=1 Tax=Streptomyces roseus TaxID=66430 RepID=UPI003687FFB9
MTMEHPADVLTDLIGVLGDVLRVKPEKIDPEQTFQSMGLDSLLVVEFVAVVNTRYGLRVRATDLYDFPTPVSFAREVARAASGAGSAAPVPAAAAPVPVAAPAAAMGYEAPPAAPAPAARQAPAAAAATRIAEELREQLAGILCCDPWDINTTAAFNVLGVDSMVGAEFIAVVNRSFGLRERSVLLYEHPNLAAMAAYIATRTGAAAQAVQEAQVAQAAQAAQAVHTAHTARTAQDFAPAPRMPEPAYRPAAAGAASAVPAVAAVAAVAGPGPAARPLPAGDLDVLLDAIRDDRLTVDEALVLLGRRG